MDQIHPVLEDRESEEALPTPSRKLNNRVLLVYLILLFIILFTWLLVYIITSNT
tara:strand:- start:120 stop:281 length:162 start_codon:yes stop_codon:yes gene_type:complete